MTRGRKPLTDPGVPLSLHLPQSLRTRLDIVLFSPLEGRVPKGAYQAFIAPAIVEALEWERLDLAPFLSTMPGECVVRGPASTIARLRTRLEQCDVPS